MSPLRILAIVLLVMGVVTIFFGINSTQKIPEQIYEGAVGRYTSGTMKYLISGASMIAAGAACFLMKK